MNYFWRLLVIYDGGQFDFFHYFLIPLSHTLFLSKEFIAFLGSCGAEFDSANKEMQRMTKEDKLKFASQRLSVKNLSIPDGHTEE